MHNVRRHGSCVSHAGWIVLSILAILVVTGAPVWADECITHPADTFTSCGHYSGGCAETYHESGTTPHCLLLFHRFEDLPPFGAHKLRMAVTTQDSESGDVGESLEFGKKQLNGCDGTGAAYTPVVTCSGAPPENPTCTLLTDYDLSMSGTTDICIEVESLQHNPGHDEVYVDSDGGGCSEHPVIVTTLPADTEKKAAADHSTNPGTIVESSYLYTQTSNNTYEVLQEGSVSGGQSKLKHVWRFDNVPAGTSHELLIEGFRPNNTDGDNFQFGWNQTGGGMFQTITGALISSSTESSANYAFASGALNGTVYIAVWDTVANGSHLATVFCDKIVIRTIYDCP